MSLKHSLEHFAQGTGCMQLQWPQDKENRKEGKRGGNPPEALLAYGSSEERQAALDQNQQRPGEWGFYAAAAKGAKESKDRKNNRNVAEGDEQVAYHREAFSELQPPQVGRGGLLGDAPSDWGYDCQVQQQNLVWTNEEVNSWQQQWASGSNCFSPSGQWPSNNTASGDDWAQSLYIDPPAQQHEQPMQQQPTNAVLQPAGQTSQLPPQLPPVEDLVRNLDFLDDDEAEYRSPVMCLPTGLVAESDEAVPFLRSATAPQLDMDECFMPAESTPPRMRRAHTYTHTTPPRPTTPGSAGHAAVYHQVHPGLPCRHTFIHFDHSESSASYRSRSCPADCRAAAVEEPVLQRASTLDEAPPMWAHDDAIVMTSDMPVHSPVRHRMLEAIETPQRVQGFALGEEHTPAPRNGAPRARRGGRGRHGKGPNSHNKLGAHGLSGTWRPTLWTEGH